MQCRSIQIDSYRSKLRKNSWESKNIRLRSTNPFKFVNGNLKSFKFFSQILLIRVLLGTRVCFHFRRVYVHTTSLEIHGIEKSNQIQLLYNCHLIINMQNNCMIKIFVNQVYQFNFPLPISKIMVFPSNFLSNERKIRKVAVSVEYVGSYSTRIQHYYRLDKERLYADDFRMKRNHGIIRILKKMHQTIRSLQMPNGLFLILCNVLNMYKDNYDSHLI